LAEAPENLGANSYAEKKSLLLLLGCLLDGFLDGLLDGLLLGCHVVTSFVSYYDPGGSVIWRAWSLAETHR
jgi:hypothetical protein